MVAAQGLGHYRGDISLCGMTNDLFQKSAGLVQDFQKLAMFSRVLSRSERLVVAIGQLRRPSSLQCTSSRTRQEMCSRNSSISCRRMRFIVKKGSPVSAFASENLHSSYRNSAAFSETMAPEPPSGAPAVGAVLSPSDITQATGGLLVTAGPAGCICTDTRKLKQGDWFLALEGPNFNGHDFLESAAQAGCVGAIGRVVPSGWSRGFVRVPDTLAALQDLARQVRIKFLGPVVAITGSSGKTTTRAMTGLALESLGHVHQTAGNLNNHVGVPLTLLAMSKGSSACVLELGMNHSGEIAQLAEIAIPSVRVVLNVGKVHLEGLGSVEGVARAKGELLVSAQPGDICVINADDPLVASLPIPAGVKVVRFGTEDGCDVRLVDVETTKRGFAVKATIQTRDLNPQTATIEIQSPGTHLALNACAAAAIAVSLGVPLQAAVNSIAKYVPVGQRLKVEEIATSSTLKSAEFGGGECEHGSLFVINDTYNANPMSVNAALELLATLDCPSGNRIALLGDMLELGEDTESCHVAVLERCRDLGIESLGLVGKAFVAAHERMRELGVQNEAVRWTADDLQGFVFSAREHLKVGDVVLVKGSRGMRMETLVELIKEDFEMKLYSLGAPVVLFLHVYYGLESGDFQMFEGAEPVT